MTVISADRLVFQICPLHLAKHSVHHMTIFGGHFWNSWTNSRKLDYSVIVFPISPQLLTRKSEGIYACIWRTYLEPTNKSWKTGLYHSMATLRNKSWYEVIWAGHPVFHICPLHLARNSEAIYACIWFIPLDSTSLETIVVLRLY